MRHACADLRPAGGLLLIGSRCMPHAGNGNNNNVTKAGAKADDNGVLNGNNNTGEEEEEEEEAGWAQPGAGARGCESKGKAVPATTAAAATAV